ncbi:MAG TPA: helix-turn-helix domain-containing protein [Aldersonia sp.]
MPPEFDPAVARWLNAFAVEAREPQRMRAWVDLMNKTILEQVPEIDGDALLRQDLDASSQAHWENFLTVVAQQEHRVVLPPPVSDFALSIARRGFELNVLLKIYRVAQQALWNYIIDVVDELPPSGPDRTALLVHFWSRAGSWIDHTVENLIAVYHVERQRITQGAMARRLEIVGLVLAGKASDARQLTVDLGYPMLQHHTAYVLWTDDNERVGELTGIANALGTAIGHGPPLALSQGTRELWCWTASPKAPVTHLISSQAELLEANQVRAAVGIPSRGVDGFRTSHGEARATQRLSVDSAARPTVLEYGDVELVSLMRADATAADRFVNRVLGRLASDDKGMDRLRETLYTFVTNAGDLDAVAETLIVHRNTVRYRIRQAEEILGHRVGERRADVEVALRHLAVLGRL